MPTLHRLDPRRSLTSRIILVNLTLVTLALGGFVLWTGWRLQRGIIEEAESGLEVRALILANGLREPLQQQIAFQEAYEEQTHQEEADEAIDGEEAHAEVFAPIGNRDFKTLIDSYARELGARVTVLGPDLTVTYSSAPRVSPHVAILAPEVVAAAHQQEEHAIREDAWTDEERLFVAAPILGDAGVQGVVQLSIPFAQVSERVRAMWLTLISVGLALTLLFVIASIVLGEQITRPLRRLTAAAHRLAGGDLSVRMDMERGDELGDLAAAFDHMAEEISQLLARERAFVANASHELRSPVTAIQLRAELLQMASADDVRRERYIREIRQESDNLGRLLQQLLDLDRAQSTPLQAAEPMDMAPCLRKVNDLMQPLAQHAGLTLSAAIPDSLPPVRMAEQDCEIIFRNLLDNAIKYTPAGGQVQVSARAANDWVEVVVRDTGIGIPAQELPHIFDRFYRVDKARDRTGSGLGLALVKEIVTQYGGEIRAESAEEAGVTMTARFRRAG